MLQSQQRIPEVTKNLLIINVLAFIANMVTPVDLNSILGLYYFASPEFHPYQLVTHMFMHGSIMHIFFNMFALWMFGTPLEQVWGPKRFLIFYFVTALGAAFLHEFVNYLQISSVMNEMDPESIRIVMARGAESIRNGQNFIDPGMAKLNLLMNIPVVGASGAIFGLLLGFGMLFPNTRLMLLFPPIPIKAKYFVIGYGLIELFSGVLNRPGDNVAHFAHVGGMLFGFILIKIWQKRRDRFY
jgi:membrane associated rhomboid family serine protease